MKRGKDLLKTIEKHPSWGRCQSCAAYIGNVALADLVYTFESCKCKAAKYAHLVETIYHRDCFRAAYPYPLPPEVHIPGEDMGSTGVPAS